jgi:itaconyl-CoA hydratase
MKTPEDSGKHFEDFRKGQKLEGKVGRTITETDNIWFTLLTNNSNQIHFNADYAKRYFPGKPFEGRMVVNGFFTLGLVAGLLVDVTSVNGFMLGIDKVKYLKPVFPGDTLYAECEVVAVRPSSSQPGLGIVVIACWGLNQHGAKVIKFSRSFMVRKRKIVWGKKRRT